MKVSLIFYIIADELDYEIERQVVPCPCSACSTPYPLAIALVPRIQLKSRYYLTDSNHYFIQHSQSKYLSTDSSLLH